MKKLLFLFIFLGFYVSSCKHNKSHSLNQILQKYYLSESLDANNDKELSRYKYVYKDLNQDGLEEALIYHNSAYFCGTGGCNLLIIDGQSNEVTINLKLVSEPISLGSSGNKKSILQYTQSGGGSRSLLKNFLVDPNSGKYDILSEVDESIEMQQLVFNETPEFFLK